MGGGGGEQAAGRQVALFHGARMIMGINLVLRRFVLSACLGAIEFLKFRFKTAYCKPDSVAHTWSPALEK